MKRTALRLAVVGALAALAIAGCGGRTTTSDSQTTNTKTNVAPTSVVQTNGLERKSATQVQLEAAAALKTAKSVHVTGVGRDEEGNPMQLELRIQGDSSAGTIKLAGGQIDITTIGNDTYLKANRRAYKLLGLPPTVQRRAAGRWAKVPTEQMNLEGLSQQDLAGQLAVNGGSPLEPTVEQTTLDDSKVVVISQQDGSRLYVANTGPAYPLRGDSEDPDVGRIDFTEYGADFHITAPSKFIDMTQTQAVDV